MVCRKYERLMVDYLAGELTQAETNMLMAHLKICPDCARSFEEYREVIEKSKSIDIPVPELDVWEKKLSEIKAGYPFPHRIHLLKPVSIFAALLLIVSLFFARVTSNGKGNKVIVRNKNGYGIVLTSLPYPEKTILEKIEYIDEESASEILKIVFDAPILPLYEE